SAGPIIGLIVGASVGLLVGVVRGRKHYLRSQLSPPPMPRPLAKDVTRAALRWMAGGAVVAALLATLSAWADGAWADRPGRDPWLVGVMLVGLLGGVCGAVLGVVTRVVPPSASGMVLVALAAGLLSAPVGVAFGALLEPPGEALVMGLGLALGAGLIAVKELKVQKDALYDGV